MTAHPDSEARAVIAYEPPAGGQAVRPRDPRGALAAVRRFLDACTLPTEPSGSVSLAVSEPAEFSPPDYAPEALLAGAIGRFGVGRREELGRRFPDGTLLGHKHTWMLPHACLDDVADLLAPLPAWPSDFVSPVLASVAWRVALRDPGSAAPLPDAAPASRVMLFLSTASHAAFELTFPFARPDEAFLAYLGAIRPFVPVRMAWSRFRHRVPRRNGAGYAARRIPPGLFDGL